MKLTGFRGLVNARWGAAKSLLENAKEADFTGFRMHVFRRRQGPAKVGSQPVGAEPIEGRRNVESDTADWVGTQGRFEDRERAGQVFVNAPTVLDEEPNLPAVLDRDQGL